MVAMEFFTVNTKLAEMAILAQKKQQKRLLSVGLDLMQEIVTGLGVQYLTN